MDKWDKYQDWHSSMNHFLGNEFWDDFRELFQKDDPHYNLYESPDQLLCVISLPGLNDINSIAMYTNHTTLSIKGRLNYSYDGYRILQNELFQGSFERDIPLPYPVQNKPIQASYERGLLIVQLYRLINEDEQELIIIEDRERL